MSKSSIFDSPYGASADIAESAVVMHDGRGSKGLKEDNALAALAIREKSITREALINPATSRKEIHRAQYGKQKTVENNNSQRSSSGISPLKSNPAQEAALRRLNGSSSPRQNNIEVRDSAPSSNSQPVLVRTYSASPAKVGSSRQAEMEKNRKYKAKTKSYDLPPLESFSFQDILASIDPEIRLSIDAIAEICGRSKLSLADEYGSHRPPQGELTSTQERDLVALLPAHLVSIQISSHQTSDDRRNSASLALVYNSNQRKTGIPSVPTAATSNVNSEIYSESSAPTPSSAVGGSISEEQSSLLPHVLAWIRRSSASFNGSSLEIANQANRDPSVALHRILTKAKGKVWFRGRCI